MCYIELKKENKAMLKRLTIIILSSAIISVVIYTSKIDLHRSDRSFTVSYLQDDTIDPYDIFIDQVISIAKAQPTYPVIDGKTIYGEMFGNPTYAWCTEFVMYNLKQAEDQLNTNYINDVYPWLDSAYASGLWYQRKSRFFPANEYIPEKGDLIFFDTAGFNYPDHTGLVIDMIHQYGIDFVVTIEGNIPNDRPSRIRIRQLPLDHADIFGYGSSFHINDNQGPIGYY